jgi:hypothetical protein
LPSERRAGALDQQVRSSLPSIRYRRRRRPV